MMKTNLGGLATAAVFYATSTTATTAPYCSTNKVCFRWGVPETAVSSGSGDVYFQIKAPSSYSWVALGTGSRMDGSHMFIIYTDGDGNVTLSPRIGIGHDEPVYSPDNGVKLIEGSEAAGSEMTANIQCSNCASLLDFQGTNSWITAWKEGGSLDSTSASKNVVEHDGTDSFGVDMAAAIFNSSGNPFNSDFSNNSGSGSSDGVILQGSTTRVESNTLVYAHGIVMAVVFVIAYPVGAVAMPLIQKWFIHAGWQVLAFLGMWVGFGIGCILAKDGGWWNSAHVELGIVVCVLLLIQPILGWLHHLHFVKHGERGLISHAHVWYGRILMLVGIVNGGLGLQLSNAPNTLNIIYSIVAAIFGALYIISAGIIAKLGKKKKRFPGNQLTSSQTTLDHELMGYDARS